MAENPDYRELLQHLNDFQVEYLIVGGYALMKYSEPRFTKDLDIWVHNTLENAARVHQALNKFGAPLDHDGITPQTFAQHQVVYQIGIAPVRIDIISEITGVKFLPAWKNRVPGTLFGVSVHFISMEDLMVNKQTVGRDVDIEQLKRISKQK
jgi:predicted nucleotidyltransferase